MLYDLEKYPKRRDLHSGFLSRFSGLNLLEDFPYHTTTGGAYPAVNIIEYDKDYEIELAAPGMCRKDYEITLERDTLKVASIKNFNGEDDSKKYSRREFARQEFEKTFILPENADTETISASCMEGILLINIPKKIIETRSKSRTIAIK